MKKFVLALIFNCAILHFANAQWVTSTVNVNNIYNSNTGYVGIGNSNPQTKLDVTGGIYVVGSESHFSSATFSDPVPNRLFDIKIGAYGIAVNGSSVFNNGISIGTSTLPSGYSFAVNGSAIATSITVKAFANWPDYVFKPSYHLPSLSEVKTYVDLNHHLPEIPSEKEIATNGLNLGDIDRLLTKKVEELTLYLIEKDKQLNEVKEVCNNQQKQIEVQHEQLQSQQDQIDELKSQLKLIIKQKNN